MPRIYKEQAGELPHRRSRLRVVLADDHAILRHGLRAILEAEPDLEVVGEASTVQDAVALSRCLQESERAAIAAGAYAYIVKDSPVEVLLRAIRSEAPEVERPAPPVPRARLIEQPAAAQIAKMTERELQVLVGVALGYSSKRIAGNLGRSVKTIEKHRFKMMHRLGLHNAAAVTRFAIDNGLLQVDDEDELQADNFPRI